jgi:proteasome lid subunit RPN8/RPN11
VSNQAPLFDRPSDLSTGSSKEHAHARRTDPLSSHLAAEKAIALMDTLERAITQAHRSGDQALLEKLRAEYRTRDVIRPSPSVRIIESGGHAPVARNGNGTRRATPVPRIVELRKYAHLAIHSHQRGDLGQETGGLLWGMVVDNVAMIDQANELGHGAERGPTHLLYDRDYMAQYEYAAGRPAIGEWHSHPGILDPQPSADDLACWSRHAREERIPWVSIIVGDDGVTPNFTMKAWITEKGHTHPATLLKED